MPPEEAAPEEQTEKKKSRGTLKSLLTIVIIVGVFGALGLVVTRTVFIPRMGINGSGDVGLDEEGTAGGEKEKPTGAPIFYDPIELIVNIQDKTSPMDRFLIVEIFLQLDAETLREEIAAMEPRVKDLFIGVLRSKTVDDLKGAQGQDRVKRELVEKVNTLLDSGRVVDASFGKFQIQ